MSSPDDGDCAILRGGGTACTWDQNNPSVPTDASVVDIAITEYGHACGIDSTGVVTCWNLPLGASDPQWANRPGDTTARVVRLGQPATSLRAGDYNECALLENGTVKCWDCAIAAEGPSRAVRLQNARTRIFDIFVLLTGVLLTGILLFGSCRPVVHGLTLL